MKVLYILRGESDDTIKKLIEVQKKENEVKVLRLHKGMSYDELVDDIFSYDKVISW